MHLIPSGELVVIFLVPGSYPFSGQPSDKGTARRVSGMAMILASLLKFFVSICDLVCPLFL